MFTVTISTGAVFTIGLVVGFIVGIVSLSILAIAVNKKK